MVVARRFLTAFAGLVLATSALSQANAAYIAAAGAVDAKCNFSATQNWTFPGAGADNSGPLGGANWAYSLSSPAPAAPGNRNLTVDILHLDPGPCDVAHAAAPVLTLSFPNVQRPPVGPQVRSAARKELHGVHADYGLAALTVPAAGNITANIRGFHGADPGAGWSFTNIGAVGYSSVVVIPSYRNADGSITNGMPIQAGAVGAGATKNGVLPRDDNGNQPANYTVRAFGSPMTETTLAFLGQVPGISGITELELGPMIAMFGGSFVAPVLREHDQDQDLFVFIDLTTFLGAEVSFSLFHDYDFIGGTSADLPGIYAFIAPFTLGPGGVPLGQGFNGVLFADAMIDGTTVAAPGALALLPAFAALAGWRRRVSARAARAPGP